MELGREEADAAIEVAVTVGFVGVTEVGTIIGVDKAAAGTATFAVVEEEVENTTEAVDNEVVVEAEAAVLEV